MKFLGVFIALFFIACSSYNGVASFMEEKISQEALAYSSARNYYSSSSSVTYYNECAVLGTGCSSGGGYSPTVYPYTIVPLKMKLILTSFQQLTDWECGLFDSVCNNFSNGDPNIWFDIEFFNQDSILLNKVTTLNYISSSTDNVNLGYWYGNEDLKTYYDVPVGTYYIWVRPHVVDLDDGLDFNDDVSSGYAYGFHQVGYSLGTTFYQEDYNSKNYILTWKFDLYK